MKLRDRIIGFERIPRDKLRPHPNNWRTHNDAQRNALKGVLAEVGIVDAVIARPLPDGTYVLVDGHLRSETIEQDIPTLIVDLDDREAAEMLATLDPLAAMAGANAEALDSLLREFNSSNAAVQAMLAELSEKAGIIPPDASWASTDDAPEPQIHRADELREKWGTARGQVWEVGRHRLMCGDSTSAEDVGRLMGGRQIDGLLTDPPYCSGGFQEAAKKAGSVGTRGTEMIANDTLSTRGYTALMKTVLERWSAGIAYIFTDWRMWIPLFDVVEASGFGVRNMVVWDKGSPGMGNGWRMQHELVMVGVRVSSPFDPKKAQGNVIQAGRTGNVHHATQKPVELLQRILEVTDQAECWGDPFCGSASTVLACEQTGKTCLGMELTPRYLAVSLQRLSDMGLTPRKVEG